MIRRLAVVLVACSVVGGCSFLDQPGVSPDDLARVEAVAHEARAGAQAVDAAIAALRASSTGIPSSMAAAVEKWEAAAPIRDRELERLEAILAEAKNAPTRGNQVGVLIEQVAPLLGTIPGVGVTLAGLAGSVGFWLRSRKKSAQAASYKGGLISASKATAQMIEHLDPVLTAEQRKTLAVSMPEHAQSWYHTVRSGPDGDGHEAWCKGCQ